MSSDDLPELYDLLASYGALSESLLKSLCLVNHGFSVLLEFEIIMDSASKPLTPTRTLWIALEGVVQLVLRGGLTDHMLADPESINWGLSEVARVATSSDGDDTLFSCQWESSRFIEIRCRRAVGGWSRDELDVRL